MADDTHVHVTQALKGSLSDVKPEQDPHATPPHRFTPTSDEDALTPPYPPPEDGLDSIQLEDELSSPGLQGMQGVKAEHGNQVTLVWCMAWHVLCVCHADVAHVALLLVVIAGC